MDNETVSWKDIAAFGIGILLFIISFFLIPTETISQFTGDSKTLVLLVKGVISLILAVVCIFGVYLVLNPKSAKQLMDEAERLAFKQQTTKLHNIGQKAKEAARFATRPSAATAFKEAGDLIQKLAARYFQEEDVVACNDALNLFGFLAEDLDAYLPMVKGESLMAKADLEREIRETETEVAPKALKYAQRLGSRTESHKTLTKDTAQQTMEELARSMGLEDDN